MNKESFDEILKQNIISTVNTNLFGYVVDGKTYSRYYNEVAFNDFLNQMKCNYHSHYECYTNSPGNELICKKGRYGMQPPKMASVASSSRFCYLALKDGAISLGSNGEVEFEHECPIKNVISGTSPQMDAYVAKDNIFIEVKCHEIFDYHKVLLKNKYFDCIFGAGNEFGFSVKTKTAEPLFEISLSSFGINKKSTRFDIKQLICHLLGIKSHKQREEKAKLVYLFFKPKVSDSTLQAQIDKVFDELINEINLLFGGKNSPIRKFAQYNNIELSAVAEYDEVMSPLTKNNLLKLFP